MCLGESSGERLISDEQICGLLREACVLNAGSCLLGQAGIRVEPSKLHPRNHIVEKNCDREPCGLLRDSMVGCLTKAVEIERTLRRAFGVTDA